MLCRRCSVTHVSVSSLLTVLSFACSEDSSTNVTYRARLSGTSEQDSASLISLIEDWVATGPTIHVRGVLMRVGEECSATISNRSGGVCSSSKAQTDSTSTPWSHCGRCCSSCCTDCDCCYNYCSSDSINHETTSQ